VEGGREREKGKEKKMVGRGEGKKKKGRNAVRSRTAAEYDDSFPLQDPTSLLNIDHTILLQRKEDEK
jgi:hypothetical protein